MSTTDSQYDQTTQWDDDDAEMQDIRRLFRERASHTNIQTGKQLKESALEAFQKNGKQFMEKARAELAQQQTGMPSRRD
ncbi:hypothetical protein [Bifidobacterium callitrichidarum]|nr:hypothetical protein [Bifidobacterium callitrichidarum]